MERIEAASFFSFRVCMISAAPRLYMEVVALRQRISGVHSV